MYHIARAIPANINLVRRIPLPLPTLSHIPSISPACRAFSRSTILHSPSPSQFNATGPATVKQPGEGESFWQPTPANGYVIVNASPWYTPGIPFSQGVQVLPPGGRVRTHMHTDQHEVITCLEGEGSAIVTACDSSGSTSTLTHPMRPGTTLTLCPGSVHSFQNDSPSAELRFLWTITPGGLEDFFAQIGRKRTPGETPPQPFDRPTDPDIDAQSKMKA